MNVGNRVLWSVIGLILLAAGVFGVLASQGWLAGVDPDQPVLTPAAIQRWNSWGNWPLIATTALAVLLVVLGFLLISRQLRRGAGTRLRDLLVREPARQRPSPAAGSPGAGAGGAATQLPPLPGTGTTRVASNALHHALTNDLETDRHVRRAAVRITGQPADPQLHVRLATTADADVAGLADAFDRAMTRFTTTSGLRPAVAEVTVTMPDRQPERVH